MKKKLSKIFLISSSLFSLSFTNPVSAATSFEAFNFFSKAQKLNPAGTPAASPFQGFNFFNAVQNKPALVATPAASPFQGFNFFGVAQQLSPVATPAASPFQGFNFFNAVQNKPASVATPAASPFQGFNFFGMAQKSSPVATPTASPFQGFNFFGMAQKSSPVATPTASPFQGFNFFGVAQKSSPVAAPAVAPFQGFNFFNAVQNKPAPVASPSQGFNSFKELENNLEAAGKRLVAENERTEQLREQVEAHQQAEAKKAADAQAGQVEVDRIMAVQAENDRIAAEQAEVQRVAVQAENDRIAAEQAEVQRVAVQAENDRIAAEQAEAQRVAAQVENDRITAEQAEAQRGAIQAEADRIAAETVRVQNFLSQNLEIRMNIYGYESKTLINAPEYLGNSNLYPILRYPKIPRLHAYHHNAQHTYLDLEVSKNLISSNLLNQIFRDIPLENINVFFLAQDTHENNILLRPHYYIDSDIPDGSLDYNSAKQVSASFFNLGNNHISLQNNTGNDVEEGNFFTDGISTHPSNPVANGLIASPANFAINQFDMAQGGLFASIITGPTTDGTQRKGALTIHYIPPQDDTIAFGPRNVDLHNRITGANTIEDGLRALQIAGLDDIEDFAEHVAYIAQTVSDRRDREEG